MLVISNALKCSQKNRFYWAECWYIKEYKQVGHLDIYILFFFLSESLDFMPNDYNCIDTCNFGWGGEGMITRDYTASRAPENVSIQNKITDF